MTRLPPRRLLALAIAPVALGDNGGFTPVEPVSPIITGFDGASCSSAS